MTFLTKYIHSLWLSRRSLSGNNPSSANNCSVRVCLCAPVHTRAALRWTCSRAADSLTVQLSHIMSQYSNIGKIIVLYKEETPDLGNLCFTKFKIWIALLALFITVKICFLQLRLLVIVSPRCTCSIVRSTLTPLKNNVWIFWVALVVWKYNKLSFRRIKSYFPHFSPVTYLS